MFSIGAQQTKKQVSVFVSLIVFIILAGVFSSSSKAEQRTQEIHKAVEKTSEQKLAPAITLPGNAAACNHQVSYLKTSDGVESFGMLLIGCDSAYIRVDLDTGTLWVDGGDTWVPFSQLPESERTTYEALIASKLNPEKSE